MPPYKPENIGQIYTPKALRAERERVKKIKQKKKDRERLDRQVKHRAKKKAGLLPSQKRTAAYRKKRAEAEKGQTAREVFGLSRKEPLNQPGQMGTRADRRRWAKIQQDRFEAEDTQREKEEKRAHYRYLERQFAGGQEDRPIIGDLSVGRKRRPMKGMTGEQISRELNARKKHAALEKLAREEYPHVNRREALSRLLDARHEREQKRGSRPSREEGRRFQSELRRSKESIYPQSGMSREQLDQWQPGDRMPDADLDVPKGSGDPGALYNPHPYTPDQMPPAGQMKIGQEMAMRALGGFPSPPPGAYEHEMPPGSQAAPPTPDVYANPWMDINAVNAPALGRASRMAGKYGPKGVYEHEMPAGSQAAGWGLGPMTGSSPWGTALSGATRGLPFTPDARWPHQRAAPSIPESGATGRSVGDWQRDKGIVPPDPSFDKKYPHQRPDPAGGGIPHEARYQGRGVEGDSDYQSPMNQWMKERRGQAEAAGQSTARYQPSSPENRYKPFGGKRQRQTHVSSRRASPSTMRVAGQMASKYGSGSKRASQRASAEGSVPKHKQAGYRSKFAHMMRGSAGHSGADRSARRGSGRSRRRRRRTVTVGF